MAVFTPSLFDGAHDRIVAPKEFPAVQMTNDSRKSVSITIRIPLPKALFRAWSYFLDCIPDRTRPHPGLERSFLHRLMRNMKNDGAIENPSVGVVRPRGKASPWATMALGAGAYLLLAALVDVCVVRVPEGNRYLHTLLVTLLGLAFVAAAEGFLAVIQAISPAEMLGWPFRAGAVGSVAYSVVYGHSVFVNYWYWDDWGYLVPRPFDMALVTGPLNDHFLPLLKIVLWGTTRVFGFDYIGAACLQQAAFLLLILALAHLLWSAARRPWLLILLVGLFAMWPSYGVARTWFCAGFWLTASAALLAVYVLHARRIVFGEKIRLKDLAVSAVLAAATVFISSQTLLPAVYLVAFCFAALLVSERRIVDVRRLGILCSISLVPTAVALWGRSVYVVRSPMNPSGLFDGQLFTNLGAFILDKALFASSFSGWLPLVVLAVLFVLPLAAAAIKLAASKVIDPGRRADLAGLMLGGCAIFVLSLAQIGLGRRWTIEAALNTYYVTLPFFGLWLAWAGIGLALACRPEAGTSTRPARSVAIAVAAVLAAAGLSGTIVRSEPPFGQRLRLIHSQRQFIDDLGAAVCDLALLHRAGPPVHWVPSFDFSNCKVCESIIGPPQFFHDTLGFDSMTRIAARRACPGAELRMLGQAAVVTDGSESKAAMSFLRRYLSPLDLTIVPPEIPATSVQIRGKSAMDSLNGSAGHVEHGPRSFLVTGGAITSCDGWAFDDLTKAAPEHVWIEFTNTETHKRYYWPAHRYSRPAFSRGLNLSTEMSGISCDAARYALPVGVYTMKVYQIEGKVAMVSDFSTWSISPTIAVK